MNAPIPSPAAFAELLQRAVSEPGIVSDAYRAFHNYSIGRNLRHLVTLLEELQSMDVSFVSLGEGIDCTTPAGKLQLHILAALAEFERGRIRERVMAGLQRARTQGKRLGRPKVRLPIERLQTVAGLPIDTAAERLGVSRSTVKRWRRQVQQSPSI